MAKVREFRLLSPITAILILLMMILISEVGAVVPTSSSSLFDDSNGDAALQAMEGVWHGVPTFAVPGPLTSPSGFNMTVAPVGNTSVTKMWLLSDVFAGYLINGSYQQFWANQRAGTLEYCVAVVNWLYGEPAMFAVPFVTTGSTGPSSSSRGRSSRSLKGRSIWWSAVNQTYTAIWTLTIVDEEGNQLHSELLMDGAKHLEVTYTRVVSGGGRDVNKSSGDKKKKKIINQDTTTTTRERIQQYLPEETKTKMEEVEQMVTTAAAATTIGDGGSSTTSNGLPPICHQISLPPNSEKPALEEERQSKNNLEQGGARGSLMEKRSSCPYGFSSGQIPKFVEDQLAARKKSKNQGENNNNTSNNNNNNNNNNNSSKTQQHQHDDEYQYCYWINPAMNLKVRWTINNATQAIDVLVSATKQGLGSQSNRYLAIGIKPNWPLMQGMDIALGFAEPVLGRGCVQSLYAEVNLGSPEKNPSQVLYNTSSWITTTTQDDVRPEKGAKTGSVVEETLWVQFSRPFNTGHHNLLNTSDFPQAVGPMIAFAQGPVYPPPQEEPHSSSSWLEKNLTHICDSSIAGYHGYQRGVYGFEWMRPEWALNDYMRCDRN